MTLLGTGVLALVLQTSLVQGVVLRKGTTERLSKATVELHRDPGSAGILDSVTTEDDGRFSFSNVEPGHYRLIVTRRGYARPPLAITITAGQPVENIQLNMSPAGSISGHVFDAQGRPMGNVEVQAMKASYPEGRRTLTPVQSVRTNDLGEYRLFWLPQGRYYAAAIHPKVQGMSQMLFSAVGMSMGGPAGMVISKGKADPALGESGYVPNPDPESVRYAPIYYGGTADEQTASGIDLREGADFGGVNFVVGPVQPRHVRGVVIDGITGRAAQYGSITLLRGPDAPRMKDVEVDRDTGQFDMVLFPGSHALTANSASGEGYAAFTLGDADIDNFTIPTTPVYDIPGRIVVDGPPIASGALEALQLSLRRDPPRGEQLSLSYSNPLPDRSFTLSASVGDYRINIAPILNLTRPRGGPTPALQNAYVKSARLGDTDILNGTLHLSAQTSETLEIVIATNPGALDGQVVKNDPGPAADIPVLLLPDLRSRNELYRATTTDASGRFHFDRIPPGDYKLFSWEEVEDGAWYDIDFMMAYESRGTPVHISEGRAETARVEVIP